MRVGAHAGDAQTSAGPLGPSNGQQHSPARILPDGGALPPPGMGCRCGGSQRVGSVVDRRMERSKSMGGVLAAALSLSRWSLSGAVCHPVCCLALVPARAPHERPQTWSGAATRAQLHQHAER